MPPSRRFAILAERDINKETFVEPWPEAGLIVADSPYDPQPSLRLEAGRVVEMDGKLRPDFDSLDTFIADHALDLAVAEEAMATPALQIARMLADINVPQTAVRRLAVRLHPSQAGRDHPAHERAGDDGWPGQDARAADACQPGARDQLEGAPGAPRRGRGRGRAARLRRGRDDRAGGAQRALQRARHPRRHADRPRRRADAVRGRGGVGAADRDERADHLRRDPLGLRHGAGVHRRRRHPLVEGVPGRGLCVARGQGALHLRHRLRGADGPRRALLDALPGGALPAGDEGRGQSGRAERLDLVHRAARNRCREASERCSPRTCWPRCLGWNARPATTRWRPTRPCASRPS